MKLRKTEDYFSLFWYKFYIIFLRHQCTFKAWTYMEIKKTYLFQYYIYKIEGGFR